MSLFKWEVAYQAPSSFHFPRFDNNVHSWVPSCMLPQVAESGRLSLAVLEPGYLYSMVADIDGAWPNWPLSNLINMEYALLKSN